MGGRAQVVEQLSGRTAVATVCHRYKQRGYQPDNGHTQCGNPRNRPQPRVKRLDVYQAKPMDRLKAIEVINKMCAFNAPEEVTMTTKSELDGKTDEELAAIIEAKRQQRKALSE